MADDDDRWQDYTAGSGRSLTIQGVLAMLAALALAAFLAAGPQARAELDRDRGKPATRCQEHRGRPGWDAVCKP